MPQLIIRNDMGKNLVYSGKEVDLSSKFFYKVHNASALQIIIQVSLEMLYS